MNTNITPISAVTPVVIKTAQKEMPFEKLTAKKRAVAATKDLVVKFIMERVDSGISQSQAITNLLLRAREGSTTEAIGAALRSLGRNGKPPSKATIHRWMKGYREEGINGLAPKHIGSERTIHDWEPRALYYLRQYANNGPGNIYSFLLQEGFDCTYPQVRSWHNSLPANIRNNPGKLGSLKYNSTMKSYTRRSTENVAPGERYQADGNMMPIYLQNPAGKSPLRLELTPVIDVRSRYIVGYYLSQSESANSTLHAVTKAITNFNHVPLEIQADNGPGFNNHRVANFYTKLGINEFHPRPGNPQDNGFVERLNRTLKNELIKRLPGYCDKDAAPEPLKRLLANYKKDRSVLLSVAQFVDKLDRYIHWYNTKRKHGTIHCIPAELWSQRQPNPPADIADAFFWDQAERTVQRCAISLYTLEYLNEELISYNGDKVLVEYNPFDGQLVKIRTLDGRWICDAPLVPTGDYRYSSIDEIQREKSKVQKLKRNDAKRQEIEDRSGLAITHEQATTDLEHTLFGNGLETPVGAATTALTDQSSSTGPTGIELDITTLDY